MIRMEKVYRVLEIVFWFISSVICTLLWTDIFYQLAVLYIPYFLSSKFEFPAYFYRVYGDDVRSLQLEHYGYLMAALLIGVVGTPKLWLHHPWRSAGDNKSKTE